MVSAGYPPVLALRILVACLLWVLVRSSPIGTESIALHVFDIHLYQTLILHRRCAGLVQALQLIAPDLNPVRIPSPAEIQAAMQPLQRACMQALLWHNSI